MKFSTIEDLKRVEPHRKPGFMAACLKRGLLTERGLEWTEEVHAQLRKEFTPEGALPSFGKMAINGIKAASRVIGAAVTGEQILVPESEMNRRQAICRECEFYRASDTRCSKCGCSTAKWVNKTMLATEQCPLPKPKWGKYFDNEPKT